MKKNISILGLGKVGLSIGLALGRLADQFHRTGYEPSSLPGRRPSLNEALDVFEKNISKSVRDAEVIFLCLPADNLKQTLQDIAPHVRKDAAIFSLSPAKTATAGWVHELFSEGIHFAGIEFLLTPKIHGRDEEDQFGSSDLFENTLAAIAIPTGRDEVIIDLAAYMTRKLGAIPFYCDLMEMDGMVSSTQMLPQLVSYAFLNATLKSPGWRDAGKFAGQEYAELSSLIANHTDSSGLSQSSILMKEHILRGLDSTINSLFELKTAIANENDEQLKGLLEAARVGRELWWQDRSNPENIGIEPSPVKMPLKGEHLRQQTGFLKRYVSKGPRKNKKG